MYTKTIIILLLMMLAGCGPGTKLSSIAGGECRIVHTPRYAVLGKTIYDRNWIEDTEEALVRGCNQPRPKARPASLDRQKVAVKHKFRPAKKKVLRETPIIKTEPEPPLPPVKPVPKSRWWER